MTNGALAELAALAGVDPRRLPADEHERWHLYQESLRQVSRWPLVLETVRFEVDTAVATSTVLLALEFVPDSERATWVAATPAGKNRVFAEKRAHDLALLEDLVGNRQVLVGEGDVLEWSQWLQLRLAEHAVSKNLLDLLAEHGLTRRIRHHARQRARSASADA
jgi:hypothetical protein